MIAQDLIQGSPHLVSIESDPIDSGSYLNQQLKDKLIVHMQYIDKYRQVIPAIRNWKWKG